MLNHDYLQGIDPLASSHDCIDAIGWEVQIGKRKKRAPKERQKRLEGEMKKHEVRVRKAKNTIAAIQNNPATHLAIAAVATLVPYGTVAAGIAEVGLGIARGISELVNGKVGKAIHKGMVKFAGLFRKNPERRARRKARKAERRAKRKGLSPDAQLLKTEIAKELKAGPETKQATKDVAKLVLQANKGDKKAQAGLASLQMLNNKKMIEVGGAVKGLKGGAKKKALAAKLEAGLMSKVFRDGVKLAAKAEKKVGFDPKAKAATISILKTARLAGNEAAQKIQNSLDKREAPKSGLLVLPDTKSITKGTFQAGGKKPGFLVEKSGAVKFGNWL